MASVTASRTASKFEKSRIEALKEERIKIQKKTFTKWINSFLDKVRSKDVPHKIKSTS